MLFLSIFCAEPMLNSGRADPLLEAELAHELFSKA